MHLAGQFLGEIKSRQFKELFEDNHDGTGFISDEHILCVQIAGLCHDLGKKKIYYVCHDLGMECNTFGSPDFSLFLYW